MRRIAALAAGVALLASLWFFFFRSETTPRIRPPREGPLVAFGDSLTAGAGATAGSDYPSLLARRLEVEVVNAGRYGDDTDSALARLEPDVLAKNPRLVILLLGGNDALRRAPAEVTFQNLETIIDRLQERRVAVLLLGIERGVFLDDYPRRFRELAREKNVEFIPDVLEGIFGNPTLMADEIHPNDRGYEMMTDRIEPVLRRMLE